MNGNIFNPSHTPAPQTAFARLHKDERGGSRLGFLVTLLLIALAGYSLMQYVPVAWNARLFRDVMQSKVDQAAALSKPTSWVTTQLRADMEDYSIPPGALVNVQRRDNRIEAVVRYDQPVALPGYIYHYQFEHLSLIHISEPTRPY